MGKWVGLAQETATKVLDVLQTDLSASATTLGLAVALSVLSVDLQYVLGALGIVFARRLASKKIAPQVTVNQGPAKVPAFRSFRDPGELPPV